MNQRLRGAHLQADALSGSLAPAQLRARLSQSRVRFDSAYTGCNIAIEKQIEEGRKRLGLAEVSLDALSPLAVLQRGFAIAQNEDGTLLRDAKLVSVGDRVKLRLAHGRIETRVEAVDNTKT